MSATNYNWTSQHPRFLADLNANGVADIVGIGPDGVWSSLNDGKAQFGQPATVLGECGICLSQRRVLQPPEFYGCRPVISIS